LVAEATSSIEQMLMVESVNGTPNSFGGLRRQHLAVGVLHAGEAGRGERHRHRHFSPPSRGERRSVMSTSTRWRSLIWRKSSSLAR
jgi:hypothetical protein